MTGVPSGPSRRQVLVTGLLGLATSTVAVDRASARTYASSVPAATTPTDVDRALGFLRLADGSPPGTTGPRLLQSYVDDFGLFRTGFVEDSALAVLALLAGGAEHRQAATSLGDALVAVATHDPSGVPCRLRRAYSAGPYEFYDGTAQEGGPILPSGQSNPAALFGLDDTDTGGAAWTGLALLHLAATTGSSTYLAGARAVGTWMISSLASAGPLGGFVVGTDEGGTPHTHCSTAQNIDCFGFLTALAQFDDDPAWRAGAEHARSFVESARARTNQLFVAGSDDGATLRDDVLSMDGTARGLLVLPDLFAQPATASTSLYRSSSEAMTTRRPSADEPLSARSAFAGPPLSTVASAPGIPVYAPGAWVGSTCQLALAARTTWTQAPADLAADLRDLPRQAHADTTFRQSINGRSVAPGSGLVAAWARQDSTADLERFQVKHVGTTAWFVLAELGANPFTIPGSSAS